MARSSGKIIQDVRRICNAYEISLSLCCGIMSRMSADQRALLTLFSPALPMAAEETQQLPYLRNGVRKLPSRRCLVDLLTTGLHSECVSCQLLSSAGASEKANF